MNPVTQETGDQLAYLSSVIAQLSTFDPESLGDDNPEAMDLVETAVRIRVAGMEAAGAKDAIEHDTELLQAWMSDPNSPPEIHYVFGVFYGLSMFSNFGEFT